MLCVLDNQREAEQLAEKYAREFQRLFSSAVSKPPVGASYDHYRSEQYQRDRGLGADFDYANYEALSIFGDSKAAIDKIAYLRDVVDPGNRLQSLLRGMPTEIVRCAGAALAEKEFRISAKAEGNNDENDPCLAGSIGTAAFCWLRVRAATAQDYPNRTITFVVCLIPQADSSMHSRDCRLRRQKHGPDRVVENRPAVPR